MLHTHANKDKTTESICSKDRTKNKQKENSSTEDKQQMQKQKTDDQELKEVDKYNYLGVNVSKQGGGGNDIVNRIRKARVSFMKLKQIRSSNIYKLRLFNTLVKPVLLYGSETWKINKGDNRKLDKCFFFQVLKTNKILPCPSYYSANWLLLVVVSPAPMRECRNSYGFDTRFTFLTYYTTLDETLGFLQMQLNDERSYLTTVATPFWTR